MCALLALALALLLSGQARGQTAMCEDAYYVASQTPMTASVIPANTVVSARLCQNSQLDYFVATTAANSAAGVVVCTIDTTSVGSADRRRQSMFLSNANALTAERVPYLLEENPYFSPFLPPSPTPMRLQAVVAHAGGSAAYRCGFSSIYASTSNPHNYTISINDTAAVPAAFVATAAAPRALNGELRATYAVSLSGQPTVFYVDVGVDQTVTVLYAGRRNVTLAISGTAGVTGSAPSALHGQYISPPATRAGRVTITLSNADTLTTALNVHLVRTQVNSILCDASGDASGDADSAAAPRVLALDTTANASICSYQDSDFFELTLASRIILALTVRLTETSNQVRLRITVDGSTSVLYDQAPGSTAFVLGQSVGPGKLLLQFSSPALTAEPSSSGALLPLPSGRFSVRASESFCPEVPMPPSHALAQNRSTAPDVSNQGVSSGFCTNDTGVHWYAFDGAMGGVMFINSLYSNALQGSSAAMASPIVFDVLRPDMAVLTTITLNSTSGNQGGVRLTLPVSGRYNIRMTRTTHTLPPQTYYFYYQLFSCVAPTNNPAATFALDTPIVFRTCVNATTTSQVQVPSRATFPLSGLFWASFTSTQNSSSGTYLSVVVGTSPMQVSLQLTGQSTPVGQRLNATGVVALEGPLNVAVSGLQVDVTATFSTVDCGPQSPAYPASYLTMTNHTAATSVAAALTAKPETLAAMTRVPATPLRGLFCERGTKHYYALNASDGTVSGVIAVSLFSRGLFFPSLGTFATMTLVRSNGASATDVRLNVTQSTRQFSMSPSMGTGEFLLVIEALEPFLYQLQQLALSGCAVGDDTPAVLTIGARTVSNLCPGGDRDQFSVRLTTAGIYNLTLDVPPPTRSIGVYPSVATYADATRTTVLAQPSCSFAQFSNVSTTQRCQFVTGAGNLTIDLYASPSTTVIDNYGIKLDLIADCPAPTPANTAATTFAGASPLAFQTSRTAVFCSKDPGAHYFAVPQPPPGAWALSVQFGSSDANPPTDGNGKPLWRLDADLLDANQNVVRSQVLATLPSLVNRVAAVPIGAAAYVLRIRRANHTQAFAPPQTYTFSYNLDACTPDADEFGQDSEYLPRLLPLGESTTIWSVCPQDDVDFFRFVVPAAGTYTLHIGQRVPVNNVDELNVRIFDAKTPNQDYVTQRTSFQTRLEHTFLTAARELVVEIQGSNSFVGDFDVALKPIASTACLTTQSPEETSSPTRPVGLNSLSPWETQQYTFSFCSTRRTTDQWFRQSQFFGDVVMRLETDKTQGDVSLAIFLAANDTAPVATLSANAAAPLKYTAPSSVPLFYRVSRTADSSKPATQTYRIIVTSYRCMGDNLASEGVHLLETVPGVSSGFFYCQNQQEDFRFTLPTATTMLTVRTTPSDFYMSLTSSEHTDDNRHQVENSQGVLQLANAPAGTYHLVVRNGQEGAFTISITVGSPLSAPPRAQPRLIGGAATPPPSPTATTVAGGSTCGNGALDDGEVCDGEPCCQTDCRAFKPDTAQCRAATSAPCDLPELCSGTAAACPTAERVRPAGTVCRAAQGECTAVTTCDGRSVQCPAASVNVGAACDDKSMCTTDDKCSPTGVCVGTSSCDCRTMGVAVCDDKNECTTDSCNMSDGKCINAPLALAAACTATAAQLTAAQACVAVGAAPVYQCTSESVCAEVASSSTCPGEPACSGRGACCNGKCFCPPTFSGADCAKPNAPGSKDLVLAFADSKSSTTGVGSTTVRVQLADGSSVVLSGVGGPLQLGDEAIGVAGTAGDADQLEFPETLTVSLDGTPFVLRGLIFSDFNAARGDRAVVTLELAAAATRRAASEPLNVTVADWKAGTELPLATSFTIAPVQGSDGFGLIAIDVLAMPRAGGSATPPRTTTASGGNGAPIVTPAPGLGADTLQWIYIGVGAGAGLICVVLLVVLVVCLVRRGKRRATADVPLTAYDSSRVDLAPMGNDGVVGVGTYGTVPKPPETASISNYDSVPAALDQSRSSAGSGQHAYGSLRKVNEPQGLYTAPGATTQALQMGAGGNGVLASQYSSPVALANNGVHVGTYGASPSQPAILLPMVSARDFGGERDPSFHPMPQTEYHSGFLQQGQ